MTRGKAKLLIAGFWISVASAASFGVHSCTKSEQAAEATDQACYKKLNDAVTLAPKAAKAIANDNVLTNAECSSLDDAMAQAKADRQSEEFRGRVIAVKQKVAAVR
jgi:hypothetical protein